MCTSRLVVPVLTSETITLEKCSTKLSIISEMQWWWLPSLQARNAVKGEFEAGSLPLGGGRVLAEPCVSDLLPGNGYEV